VPVLSYMCRKEHKTFYCVICCHFWRVIYYTFDLKASTGNFEGSFTFSTYVAYGQLILNCVTRNRVRRIFKLSLLFVAYIQKEKLTPPKCTFWKNDSLFLVFC
jgi:hypothetical protein